MKRLFGLVLVCVVVFVVVCRQRIYLRDPLASVTRDGMMQGGVTTMINYSNDVLLLDGSDSVHPRLYVVQGWNKVASVPTAPLKCVYGVACLADADHATATPIATGTKPGGVTMTNRRVEFVDEHGAHVQVVLR